MSKVKEGQPAPDFDLPGTGGRRYRLADYRGTGVILAFYPADFTLVCTRQFCSYRDGSARLERLGVPLLGVSPQSVDSHERWIREKDLTVPLLADQDKAVARAYGAVFPGGLIRRSTFLIDGAGIIRHRDMPLVELNYASVEDLERAVADLDE